jgi:hypothetical protein
LGQPRLRGGGKTVREIGLGWVVQKSEEEKRERDRWVGWGFGPRGLGNKMFSIFFQSFYQMQISLNSNQIQIFEEF